jgi:hypothetical protein
VVKAFDVEVAPVPTAVSAGQNQTLYRALSAVVGVWYRNQFESVKNTLMPPVSAGEAIARVGGCYPTQSGMPPGGSESPSGSTSTRPVPSTRTM